MIDVTSFSRSGWVPKKRRRGILMVEPTFISAMCFQNSASVEPGIPFILPERPIFAPSKAAIGQVIHSPEETLHSASHLDFTTFIVDRCVRQRCLKGNAVFIGIGRNAAPQAPGINQDMLPSPCGTFLALPSLPEERLRLKVLIKL